MCHESRIVFSWSPTFVNCSILHYSIISSNCGSCPTTSTDTNITCTHVPMNGSVCRLYVQAIICLSEICKGVNVIIPDPVPWQLSISPMCQSKLSDRCLFPHTHHLYCRSKNQHCYSTGHLSITDNSHVTTAGNFYTDMHQEMLLLFKIMVSQE